MASYFGDPCWQAHGNQQLKRMIRLPNEDLRDPSGRYIGQTEPRFQCDNLLQACSEE